MQGKALGDCTSPVIGNLGREPKVGKGRDQSGLGRNQHGKTEGYGDKRDRSPVNKSVCVSSCALPKITAVCPVCPLISCCNSFPGALFSVHACLHNKWRQTTGHRGPWTCGAGKEGGDLFQVRMWSQGVPSRTSQQIGRVAWEIGMGQTVWVRSLEELAAGGKGGSKWAAGEPVGFGGGGWAWVSVCKRQWAINGPKSRFQGRTGV